MPWAAAIAAGASLVGAYMSSNASEDAANTQANAANQASAVQQQMYNQNVQRLSPWVGAGTNALDNLTGLMGSNGANGLATSPFTAAQFHQSPGYQWALQQGSQAVANQASAMGGVNSGNTLKALTNYGQGLANQQYQTALQNYQNWQNQIYNMNAGIANTGANAAGMTAGLGAATANQIGSNLIGAGNARAAGQVGSANAWGSALGNIGQLGMYAAMRGRGGGYGGGYSTYGAGIQVNPGAPQTYSSLPGGVSNISMPMQGVTPVGGY